jgi:hypothetical protein
MVRGVPATEKFQAYSIYIAKVAKLLGILPRKQSFVLCLILRIEIGLK